jgi:hypothetical protein
MWFTTWHRPDGTAIRSSHTPACAFGPHTTAYLAKYAAEIIAVNRGGAHAPKRQRGRHPAESTTIVAIARSGGAFALERITWVHAGHKPT